MGVPQRVAMWFYCSAFGRFRDLHKLAFGAAGAWLCLRHIQSILVIGMKLFLLCFSGDVVAFIGPSVDQAVAKRNQHLSENLVIFLESATLTVV